MNCSVGGSAIAPLPLPASVAIAITGLLRSLLSQPVTSSFTSFVRSPLHLSGYEVDPFIVLSEQNPADKHLISRLEASVYAPKALRLLPHAIFKPPCSLATVEDRSAPGHPLVQWLAIGACFELIAAAEAARGAQYDWVLRLRTDLVFFAAFPMPTNAERVYLPSGGMSYRHWLRCCNDHMFLCPRRLCSPYEFLLRNFDRADCKPAPGYSAGGDGVLEDGTLRPPPLKTAVPWYVSRAYNGTACGGGEVAHPKCECCGVPSLQPASSVPHERGLQLSCGLTLLSWPHASFVFESHLLSQAAAESTSCPCSMRSRGVMHTRGSSCASTACDSRGAPTRGGRLERRGSRAACGSA